MRMPPPASRLAPGARALGLIASICAAALALPAAHAQARPDAGSILRDIQQAPPQAPRTGPSLPSVPARPAGNPNRTVHFTVVSVQVSGNTAFGSATLVGLVQGDLIGKSVTLADLQTAAAKITDYYRAHGYMVARAYVPAQRIDATGAHIEIAVIEGKLGQVTVNNQSRLSEATVARFTAPLHAGALISQNNLGRQILLLSDQAGVPPGDGLHAVLRAGQEPGQSDMGLDIGRAPLATGQLGLDNYGNAYTGALRATGQASLLSPLGLGDVFIFRYIESQDLYSGTLAASVPIGGNGLSAGANYSYTHYKLGGAFASLQDAGTAQSAGAYLAYPWVRTQNYNFNTSLGFDHRQLYDDIASTDTVTPRNIDVANLTFSGDLRNALAANSVLAWNVAFEAGHVSINDPNASAADASGPHTQGNFGKINASAQYLQAFSPRWSVYGSLTGQLSNRNLDNSEQLTLGGPYAVRAYPVGEAAGDEGAVGTVELRYTLSPWHDIVPTLALFVDEGTLRINHSPYASGSNNLTVGAAGVGFTLARARDFNVRVYWAVKVLSSASTSAIDRPNRVWLQATKYF